MVQSIQPEGRPPRVKLVGTVLALLQLENGRHVRARLHQLSVTGGLLHMDKPLDESIKVEVIFHVGSSTVRSQAVLLFPIWATHGYLQPFEFKDLGEPHRLSLANDVQRLLEYSEPAPDTDFNFFPATATTSA